MYCIVPEYEQFCAAAVAWTKSCAYTQHDATPGLVTWCEGAGKTSLLHSCVLQVWLRVAGLWLTLRPLLLSSWGGLLLTAAAARTAFSSGKQLMQLALRTLLPAAKQTLSSGASNLVTTQKLWPSEEDDSQELVTNARSYLAILTFIVICCWCNRGAATRFRKQKRAAAWQRLLPFLPSFLFYISNRAALRRGDRTLPGWRQQHVSLHFDDDAAIVRLWMRSSWAGWYRWFSAAYLVITVAFWAVSWVAARLAAAPSEPGCPVPLHSPGCSMPHRTARTHAQHCTSPH